ncbi:hypothetical protein DAEQUDRAFT_302111 [Daedalea quercina L-15889]|uniref:Uncharacterized protein n=1 Tax=Daedalea quercina L-15889 TaxID=1314783 RepID=A0A165Q629_9APHY|nr:hypothetical protein DAEQUDRAFT_302111 [Daedalea quercina L-15889]
MYLFRLAQSRILLTADILCNREFSATRKIDTSARRSPFQRKTRMYYTMVRVKVRVLGLERLGSCPLYYSSINLASPCSSQKFSTTYLTLIDSGAWLNSRLALQSKLLARLPIAPPPALQAKTTRQNTTSRRSAARDEVYVIPHRRYYVQTDPSISRSRRV